MDAAIVLGVLADFAKKDPTYQERADRGTTRWHASVDGADIELLCTGPKFYDTRSRRGGGGAIDMAMHLLGLDFKQAAVALRMRGL